MFLVCIRGMQVHWFENIHEANPPTTRETLEIFIHVHTQVADQPVKVTMIDCGIRAIIKGPRTDWNFLQVGPGVAYIQQTVEVTLWAS